MNPRSWSVTRMRRNCSRGLPSRLITPACSNHSRQVFNVTPVAPLGVCSDAGIPVACIARQLRSCVIPTAAAPVSFAVFFGARLASVSSIALMGFQGGEVGSCDQSGDEGFEQGFAASACVVHELEEAEIERQLVLRDAAVRAQPGAQQRPEALNGIDVHLAEAVAVLIARILAAPVADRLLLVAPGG